MRDGMSDLRHVTTLAVKIVFIRQMDLRHRFSDEALSTPDTYKTEAF
jgi:hypothetical protein